ncbi:Hypp2513 [Branchiostoma lanceolatum]|uniref:Hypp2513 protein n=1 Tax=Branchiostoma lanceolatum TaxID=7740 RepID=A0A8J9ZU90_BRALA|nr:Hypp2513 [Branchiostoma lanceolatum]
MRSSLSFDEWVLAGTVDSKRSICKAVSVQNGGERQRQIVHLAPHEFREQPFFAYLVKIFPKFSRHGRGGGADSQARERFALAPSLTERGGTDTSGCVRYSSTAKSPPETCGTPRSWAGLTDGRLRCERRQGPRHDYPQGRVSSLLLPALLRTYRLHNTRQELSPLATQDSDNVKHEPVSTAELLRRALLQRRRGIQPSGGKYYHFTSPRSP